MSKSSTAPAVGSGARRSRSVLLGLGSLLLLAVIFLLPEPWRSVVILGIVEGLTEFLPISSTAHLLIASDLLGFDGMQGTFEIFIQLGAVLAVVGYYARDLLGQLRDFPHERQVQRFWLGVLIAFLPAAVVGLLARDYIKAVLFESPTTIAWALIIGGLVFIVVERLPRREATTTDLQRVTLPQALITGFAQVLALVPGVSRSGSSILGGMLAGMDRQTATRFAFYLSIPTLGGATILDLLLSLDTLRPGDIGQLVVGMLVAMVVAWFSIGWLLRYVATNNFIPFGIYRIAIGLLILLLVAAGTL
jgi:undecaprenyl-diphosphatase